MESSEKYWRLFILAMLQLVLAGAVIRAGDIAEPVAPVSGGVSDPSCRFLPRFDGIPVTPSLYTTPASGMDEPASADSGLVPDFRNPEPSLSSESGDHYEAGFWRSTLRDSRDFALSPFRWDRRDWLRAATVTALVGVATTKDRTVAEDFSGKGGAIGRRMSSVGNALGDGTITLPLLAGYYGWGRAIHDDRMRDTSRLAFESFILSGLVTRAGKLAFGRLRPKDAWRDPDAFHRGGDAFPSGHTTSAFAVATVFAKQYPDKRWVAPVAYGLASLTGLARIHDRQHWASDVVAGAAIGYFTGATLSRRHGGTEWQVSPSFSGGSRGANLTLRW